MNEKPKDEAGWRRWATAEHEEVVRRAEAQQEWWRRVLAGQEEHFLRLNSMMYGGLIAIGVVMVQPFLTATSLDLAAEVCVVAFSVAIPLLAALIVLNSQETYRRRQSRSRFVEAARAVAQGSGFVGVVAGFWNILPMAGIGVLVFGILAVAVHSVGFVRVEQDGAEAPPDAVEPLDVVDAPVEDDGPAASDQPGSGSPT